MNQTKSRGQKKNTHTQEKQTRQLQLKKPKNIVEQDQKQGFKWRIIILSIEDSSQVNLRCLIGLKPILPLKYPAQFRSINLELPDSTNNEAFLWIWSLLEMESR